MNPRLSIGKIVADPLVTHGLDASPKAVIALLERVGLTERHAGLYPTSCRVATTGAVGSPG